MAMAIDLVSGRGHGTGVVCQDFVTQVTKVASGFEKQLPELRFQKGEGPAPMTVCFLFWR